MQNSVKVSQERAQDVATELLRALRGKRTRPAFSKHLGYKSNAAQRWEEQSAWPTATRFLQICERLRIDPRLSITRFLRREPPWCQKSNWTHESAIAALLSDVRGQIPITALAATTGYNRYSISRWLKGQAEPRLPEMLCLIEACTQRLVDFVSEFADPLTMPTLVDEWDRLSRAREGAFSRPWSHAVLRGLDLPFRGGKQGQALLLAKKTGLDVEQVKDELDFLVSTKQATRTRSGHAPNHHGRVDTGGRAEEARALKVTWAKIATGRLEAGAPGHLGYSLFSVSREGMLKLRKLQLKYMREFSRIIAESDSDELIGLYAAQLLDLSVDRDNVFFNHEVPPSASQRRTKSQSRP